MCLFPLRLWGYEGVACLGEMAVLLHPSGCDSSFQQHGVFGLAMS